MAADCLPLNLDDDAARLARAARFAELAAAMLLRCGGGGSIERRAAASASADGLFLPPPLRRPSQSTEPTRTVIKTHLLSEDPARPLTWRHSPVGRRRSATPNHRPSIVAALESPCLSRPSNNTITIAATLRPTSAARAGPAVSVRPTTPALPPTPIRRRPRGDRLATVTTTTTTTMAPPPGATATAGGGPPPPPRRGGPGGGGGGDGGANSNSNNNNSGRSVSPAAANTNTPAPTSTTQSATLSVATLNLRGVMDRWRERRPVLAHAFKDLDADVLCMQEVLTGEAGQEARLLRPLGYGPPLACRAALANLAAGGNAASSSSSSLSSSTTPSVGFGWPGVAFAAAVRAALAVPPLARAMAALPAGIESWREKRRVAAPWARVARDAAMAPFFGNSIAVRSGGAGASAASAEASPSSSSWPPLLVASPLAETATTRTTTETPASWPRTPGEFLAAAFGRCCGGGGGGGGAAAASSSSSPSPPDGRGRVWVAGGHEVLVLGGFRAAHRVMVGVRLDNDDDHNGRGDDDDDYNDRSAAYLWVVNAHLDHADPRTRAEQAAAIIRWMGGENEASSSRPPLLLPTAAVVLAGDFNAPASEQGVHDALKKAGFVSAYASAHGGKEPARTWPTGLQAPLADDEGEPHCADYVYVRELRDGKVVAAARGQKGGDDNHGKDDDEFRVRVLSARVAANEPWPADPTLYPSDHAAVRAVLKVERRRRAGAGRRRGQQERARAAASALAEEGF